MQKFIDNWSASLLAPATASAVSLSVEPAKAALLTGLGSGNFYRLTLVEVDASGTEIDWDVVQVTAVAGGVLTVSRTGTARSWSAGALIEARLTAEGMEELRDTAGGAAVGSDMPQALGSASPGASAQASRQDHVHPAPTPGDIGAATAAQGALADTAVQPADLATVATTGAYADLTGKPTIPSAAAEVGAIATTEKGAANGVATLGSDSKIPLAQLPATAITSTYVVANEAAMLALTAQEGDVAIRPDINTSFILAAEPASTLSNWQEILAPSAGGGAPVGSSTPQPLGTATPGVSSSASRQDHVHGMPSAADVGADPAGTAAAAVAAHAGTGGAAHANAVAGGAAGFMTGADKDKLDDIAAGATANADTDSLAEGATNQYFTEGRVRGTVLTGLSLLAGGVISAADSMLSALGKLQKQISDAVTAIGGKQDILVSGTNLTTINGSSRLGSGNLVISGGGSGSTPPQCIPIACSDETTALTAGGAKVTFRMPYGFSLTGVRASLTTAQTSGAVFTVDIKVSGVSILSTKLTVDNTEKTSATAAVPAVISNASIPEDAEIIVYIDQIGDGTANGLKVYLIGVPA